jgi:prophage regulatory protein
MVNTLDKPAGVERPPTETRTLRVIGLRAVLDKVGASKSHVYAEIRAGRFPKPISLSSGRRGWIEHEIDAWISDRMAERDNAA